MKNILFILIAISIASCTQSEINDGADNVVKFIGLMIVVVVAIVLLVIGLAVKTSIDNENKSKQRKIIKCDSCRKVINGKYIAIKPPGSGLKFDYCSTKCRDESHASNLAKIDGINTPSDGLDSFSLDESFTSIKKKDDSNPTDDLDSFPLS